MAFQVTSVIMIKIGGISVAVMMTVTGIPGITIKEGEIGEASDCRGQK